MTHPSLNEPGRTRPRPLVRYGKRLVVVGALVAASAGSCGPGQSASSNCVPPVPGAAAALGDTLGRAAPGGATSADQPITVTGPDVPVEDAATLPALPDEATVTLVTGDRVTLEVGPGGIQSVSPALSEDDQDDSTGFVRFTWGGDQFAVPHVAVPYLNTLLDPRLFDITYLVRAGLGDARSDTLPLTVGSSDAVAADSLPGVTVTGTRADRTATLDKDQAWQLGRLLAEQWKATQHGGPAPSGADALADVSRIGLATEPATGLVPVDPSVSAAPAGGRGHDGLSYHTLTVNFTGPDGEPAPAIGWIQNVDDARLGTFIVTAPDPNARPVVGATGPQKFSLPEGDYFLAFTVLSPHDGTHLGVDAALVVEPEVTVDSDTTITLDARDTTTYEFAMDPAVDPTLRVDTLSVFRTGMTGGECAGEAMYMDLVSAERGMIERTVLSASPTEEVEKGTLGFESLTGLYTGSFIDPSDGPRYALQFPHTGAIPDELSYEVDGDDLTTLRSHMYRGVTCPDTRPELEMVLYTMGHTQFLAVGGLDRVPFGERVDYLYTSDPSLSRWVTQVNNCGRLTSAPFVAEHGEEIVEHWNKAPESLVRTGLPAGGVVGVQIEDDPNQVVCSACRQDDNAMLFLRTGGDSERSHLADSGLRSDLHFYRNGEVAFTSAVDVFPGSRNPHGFTLPLLADPAEYRLVWETVQRGNDPAATIRTDWTFRSSPDRPTSNLPDHMVCAPDMTRGCSVLPMLMVGYDLDLDYQSRAEAGAPFEVAFTVTDPIGNPVTDGTATVSLSYDDGQTWTDPVAATAADGTFTAAVTHPPLEDTNGLVALRVHADDGAGNTVEQTIIRAYGLS